MRGVRGRKDSALALTPSRHATSKRGKRGGTEGALSDKIGSTEEGRKGKVDFDYYRDRPDDVCLE